MCNTADSVSSAASDSHFSAVLSDSSPESSQPALSSESASCLLGAADIRRLASEINTKPTKKFGQNFVIDPGTVRKIASLATGGKPRTIIEVGPGLGSLTLALLETGSTVVSIEIDSLLAQKIPSTVHEFMPRADSHFHLVAKDALEFTPSDLEQALGGGKVSHLTLAANLPYNLAVPIILSLLDRFPTLDSFVVMVQKEVAERLTAGPGSKIYGVPSAKLAWYGQAKLAGTISRTVFWPAPHVDSALVQFRRTGQRDQSLKKLTFSLIDSAFSQRRKTLKAALKKPLRSLCPVSPETASKAKPLSNSSPTLYSDLFNNSGINPSRRGETLSVDDFVRLAQSISAICSEDPQQIEATNHAAVPSVYYDENTSSRRAA